MEKVNFTFNEKEFTDICLGVLETTRNSTELEFRTEF